MDCRLCGKRHGAAQREVSIWWRAADVATPVVVDDSAFGLADQWFEGDRRNAAQAAGVAGNPFQRLARIEAPDALGVVVGGPVAQVAGERLQQQGRLC